MVRTDAGCGRSTSVLIRYHSEGIGPVCEPDVNRPALLVQPGRRPTTWGVADMSSVSPIKFDLGEWPWRRAVSQALATIQEDDEYEDLVASYEDPDYPHGRHYLVGDLGTAVICLRLLLVLWRMPGRRDDDGILAEGNLWLWLRARALLYTEFQLGIEGPAAMRSALETNRRRTVSERRAEVAQQLRDLIPERPRPIVPAQRMAMEGSDYPLDEALDLLESLCAELGVHVFDSWYLGQVGRFGDLGGLISELEVRRRAPSPVMHVFDVPVKRDPMAGEEPADVPLEELLGESVQPRPRGRSGPRKWDPPYDEVARHWWVLRDKLGDQPSQIEWLSYLERQGLKVARTRWNLWTGEQIAAGRLWSPPRVD